MTLNETRALAVFARSPEAGTTKTRLQPLLGEDGALNAHVELVEATLARLQSVDARRTLWVTERTAQTDAWAQHNHYELERQARGDLGDRMAASFTWMFNQGHRASCLVGTDCPLIDAPYVEAAFDALQNTDVVLGPAEDGGYGLIGIRDSALDWQALFSRIPWSTSAVLETTTERAAERGLSLSLLTTVWDVDRPEDWQRYEAWRASV